MAIALENPNLVWQKVKIALMASAANPSAVEAFFELKKYLAQQKGNPNLQFVPYSAEQIVTNGGYCPDVDACTIYGFFAKGRRTSGTTASFVTVNDATDNSGTTTTVYSKRFKVTGESVAIIDPIGQVIATDITVSGATAVGGATESSAADAADGFLVIGA